MIKKFRLFFCLVLAVILPFCFVACKSSKDAIPPSEESPSSGGETTQTPGNQNPADETPTPDERDPSEETPEINYVLDDAEVNRILKESYDDCLNFFTNLNNSNILKENSYAYEVADKTYSVLNYVFYPARFALDITNPLEKGNIYVRQVTTTFKYFEINTSDTNDKIFIKMLIDNRSNESLTAYFYEFDINKGDINSIKVSQINTNSSYIRFSHSLFDLKNSTFENSVGNVSEFSSNRTFLENNFTEERFALIDSEKWGYSYYQKFNFLGQKEYDLNKTRMPSNEQMIAQLGNFGFVNVFDELDRYRDCDEFKALDKDYFSSCEAISMFEYDNVNFIFKIDAEEE